MLHDKTLWQDRKVAVAVGGSAKGAGRPVGAVDARPRFRIAKSLAVPKWEFAKYAQQYASEMLDVLVEIAEDVERREQQVSRLQPKF